jgi:diguanylate cyclase (GGDEF)-like protein/PAS domain S-box-containing protein
MHLDTCRDKDRDWTESARLQALHQCGILDTPREPEFDDIARLAAEICGAPYAVVNFVDSDRQWFKATYGMDMAGTSRDISICSHALLESDLYIVPDTRESLLFRDNPLVSGEPYLRFYAGAVLRTDSGLPLGTVCVLDLEPRPEGLTPLQERALRALAQSVMRLVDLRHKHVEAKAREDRFRNLADRIPQMVWSADARGRLDYANRRFMEAIGIEDGDSIGSLWRSALHPEDRERTDAAWRESIASGKPYEVEHRIDHREGGYRWVLSRALPERDEAGRISGWFGSSTDIDDGKRADLALADSEARYRALTEAGAAVLWRAAPDGKIFHSIGWDVLTGQSEDAYLGEGWLDAVHPEDREAVRARIASASGRAEMRCNEYRLRVRDGSYRWVFARAIPMLDEAGRVREWVGTATDIHEQKLADQRVRESEERYRALVEASTAMVWASGPRGEFPKVAYSSSIAEYELEPTAWRSIIHPDDLEASAAAWEAALATGTPLDVVERKLTKSGDYRWTNVRANPVRNEDGTIREWIGAVTDIHERVMSRKALTESEERYRLAARATSDVIWDLDLATDEMVWGEAIETLLGQAPAQGRSSLDWWREQIHPDDRLRIRNQFSSFIAGEEARWDCEYRVIRADGSIATVFDRSFAQRDENGVAIRLVGAIQDISERQRAQTALRASETRLRLALQAGRMVAWERDLDCNFVTRSDNAQDLLGLGCSDTNDFRSRVHPDDLHKVTTLFDGFETGQSETVEVRYTTPDGRRIWLGIRAVKVSPERAIGITFDITDRKLAEEEIWQTANHDALTGLPNRTLFQARFENILAQARRDGSSVALVLVDLDEFKDVNDTLGHDAGDELLCEAARRLQAIAGENAEIARIGGDEFALILTPADDPESLDAFAERLVHGMRAPFHCASRVLSTRASAGLALFPDHHEDAAELMKDADMALYQAKAEGRSRVNIYTPAIRSRMEERIRIVHEVADAIAADQFVPFYQPKICFRSGKIVGFEALARWIHPERGVLTPGYFGAVFDDPDSAIAIGNAVRDHIARDMAAWRDASLPFGRVAINLSSAEFADAQLAARLTDRFRDHRISPNWLEIEVTETVLLGRSAELVAETLRGFDDAGVTIALDDFGTGFASLTHLKQFPVHHIKIDRSFVRDLVTDTDDAAIVAAVIGLGRSLGMIVTAEGVETAEQAQRLRLMGCDRAQGFHFAKPMVGSRIPWLLRNWDPARMFATEPEATAPAAMPASF